MLCGFVVEGTVGLLAAPGDSLLACDGMDGGMDDDPCGFIVSMDPGGRAIWDGQLGRVEQA